MSYLKSYTSIGARSLLVVPLALVLKSMLALYIFFGPTFNGFHHGMLWSGSKLNLSKYSTMINCQVLVRPRSTLINYGSKSNTIPSACHQQHSNPRHNTHNQLSGCAYSLLGQGRVSAADWAVSSANEWTVQLLYKLVSTLFLRVPLPIASFCSFM